MIRHMTNVSYLRGVQTERVIFAVDTLSLCDFSLFVCFGVLLGAKDEELGENRCVLKAQIFLFLVSHGDNWVSAVCVSFVCVPTAFVWVSHFSGCCWPFSKTTAWSSFSRVSSSPVGYHGFRVMVLICYRLSSSRWPVTSVSNPAAVFGPAEWGWKGGVFVFRLKQFTDGWRGVDLCGCDKPWFLPQKHSKPMWQSCSVCWQGEHLVRKVSASV